MYTLTKEFRFEAAHLLENHGGKCRNLHGHSFKGKIVVRGKHIIQSGPRTGMLLDYGDLKSIIEPVVEQYLDHRYLNETLVTDSPTSEFIAEWVYHKILRQINSFGVELVAVVIDETCTSRCVYSCEEFQQLPWFQGSVM